MILIADCGATKGDWVLTNGREVEQIVHTRGFNPVVHAPELLQKELEKLHQQLGKFDAPHTVYYYGAGAWDERRKGVIRGAIAGIYPNAEIQVMHDLLGAARAACGKEAGIACIIGTGSNTCLYDGSDVTDNVTNLGYLLGDEGSGAYLGKQLLRSYFYREMGPDLKAAFEQFAGIERGKMLDLVYESDTPNVYLASFTKFMGQHQNEPFIQRLLYQGFVEFIDRHVRKYPGHLHLPISFIGSIAFHFKPILAAVLCERQMNTGNFIQKPIEQLVNFHLQST